MKELRDEVRRFLDDERANGLRTGCNSWMVGWDPGFSARLAARGWVGMCVPRELGGRGRSAQERYVVSEELLAAGAPVAAHWIADRQIAPCLLRHGTPEQQAAYLPGVCTGTLYFAVGLSEPDAGSDLASIRTAGTKVAGGWRLSGMKVWTTGAHRAHALCVLARTAPRTEDPHAGLSRFLVDLPTDGVTVNPIVTMDGKHHFNEVVLDDVFVPDCRVLGEPGTGWRQVVEELAFERSGPERFLSTFPLLEAANAALSADDALGRHHVGTAVGRLWTLRQLSLAVAKELAAGNVPQVEAALVKDLGTRFEGSIVDVARTVGGVDRELLASATLDAPAFTLRGGTNEILRGIVARSLDVR